MRNQRRFSIKFKSQVIHDLLSDESGPAQFCRRYNTSSSQKMKAAILYSEAKFHFMPIVTPFPAGEIRTIASLVIARTCPKVSLTKHRIVTLVPVCDFTSSVP